MSSADADIACKVAMQEFVLQEMAREECFAQAAEQAGSQPEQDVIASLLMRAKRYDGTIVDHGEIAEKLGDSLIDYRAALEKEARELVAAPPPDKNKKSK